MDDRPSHVNKGVEVLDSIPRSLWIAANPREWVRIEFVLRNIRC